MEGLSLAWVTDPTIWIGLLTLIVLEIVLGVDNLVFIAIESTLDLALPHTFAHLDLPMRVGFDLVTAAAIGRNIFPSMPASVRMGM